jgi:hypothetical protein
MNHLQCNGHHFNTQVREIVISEDASVIVLQCNDERDGTPFEMTYSRVGGELPKRDNIGGPESTIPVMRGRFP